METDAPGDRPGGRWGVEKGWFEGAVREFLRIPWAYQDEFRGLSFDHCVQEL